MPLSYAARRRPPHPGDGRPLPASYLVWLAAATVSQLGDVVLGFAVGWVAAEHGGTAAGLVLAAGGLPSVLLLLLGGTIADRLGARRVMIAGDAVMLAVSLGLALAVLHAGTPLWLLLATSVLRGVVFAFYSPSAGSMPRRLVADASSPERWQCGRARPDGSPAGRAPRRDPGSRRRARLGGPARRGHVPRRAVVLLLVRPRYRTPPPDRGVPVWQAALDGVRVVHRTPGLTGALALLAGAAAFLLPTMSLVLPLLARGAGWSVSATGVVIGAQGAGIVAVTVVVARRGGARRPGLAASGGLGAARSGRQGWWRRPRLRTGSGRPSPRPASWVSAAECSPRTSGRWCSGPHRERTWRECRPWSDSCRSWR